jgi:hypothetical protein
MTFISWKKGLQGHFTFKAILDRSVMMAIFLMDFLMSHPELVELVFGFTNRNQSAGHQPAHQLGYVG